VPWDSMESKGRASFLGFQRVAGEWEHLWWSEFPIQADALPLSYAGVSGT
jgi:hypothetical protein